MNESRSRQHQRPSPFLEKVCVSASVSLCQYHLSAFVSVPRQCLCVSTASASSLCQYHVSASVSVPSVSLCQYHVSVSVSVPSVPLCQYHVSAPVSVPSLSLCQYHVPATCALQVLIPIVPVSAPADRPFKEAICVTLSRCELPAACSVAVHTNRAQVRPTSSLSCLAVFGWKNEIPDS